MEMHIKKKRRGIFALDDTVTLKEGWFQKETIHRNNRMQNI